MQLSVYRRFLWGILQRRRNLNMYGVHGEHVCDIQNDLEYALGWRFAWPNFETRRKTSWTDIGHYIQCGEFKWEEF